LPNSEHFSAGRGQNWVCYIVELKGLITEHTPFWLHDAPEIMYKFKYVDFWQFLANFPVFK